MGSCPLESTHRQRSTHRRQVAAGTVATDKPPAFAEGKKALEEHDFGYLAAAVVLGTARKRGNPILRYRSAIRFDRLFLEKNGDGIRVNPIGLIQR